MKLTKIGSDFIRINEANMGDPSLKEIPRVHLIKLEFKEPTSEKVEYVVNTFPNTNRFVIDDNIRFYNAFFKRTNKKYYIANKEGDKLITFFKRNNKVLLDVTKLTVLERAFIMNVALEDVLEITEVILVPQKMYKESPEEFNNWSGNLILV